MKARPAVLAVAALLVLLTRSVAPDPEAPKPPAAAPESPTAAAAPEAEGVEAYRGPRAHKR